MATLYNIVSGSNRWRFRATTWLRWSRYCTPGWKKRKRRPETSAEIRKRRLSCRPAKRNARGRRSPLRRSAPLRPNSLSAASVRREHYRHRRKLDLKKNVVCVWFCNQRQKQKRMKFAAQQSCYSFIWFFIARVVLLKWRELGLKQEKYLNVMKVTNGRPFWCPV